MAKGVIDSLWEHAHSATQQVYRHSTHTRTHMHGCTPTHTHTCMDARPHTHTHAWMHAHTHTHMHGCTPTHTHTCMDARPHTHTHTWMHMFARKNNGSWGTLLELQASSDYFSVPYVCLKNPSGIVQTIPQNQNLVPTSTCALPHPIFPFTRGHLELAFESHYNL